MSIKEKLYKEYLTIQNKVNTLTGEEFLDESEEYFESHKFKYDVKSHTKDELKNMIRRANDAYDNEIRKLRVESYYHTEEGKARKKELEEKISKLEDARKKLILDTDKEINEFIKEWLGDEWGCNVGSVNTMEIGIVEEVRKNYKCFIFGHYFTLYCGDYFFSPKGKERFEINYGTMGSFDVFNDKKRADLLIGMAEFVKNTEKLEYLKSRLLDYMKVLNLWDKEHSELNEELKNPLFLKGKKDDVV